MCTTKNVNRNSLPYLHQNVIEEGMSSIQYTSSQVHNYPMAYLAYIVIT